MRKTTAAPARPILARRDRLGALTPRRVKPSINPLMLGRELPRPPDAFARLAEASRLDPLFGVRAPARQSDQKLSGAEVPEGLNLQFRSYRIDCNGTQKPLRSCLPLKLAHDRPGTRSNSIGCVSSET